MLMMLGDDGGSDNGDGDHDGDVDLAFKRLVRKLVDNEDDITWANARWSIALYQTSHTQTQASHIRPTLMPTQHRVKSPLRRRACQRYYTRHLVECTHAIFARPIGNPPVAASGCSSAALRSTSLCLCLRPGFTLT